MRIKLEGRFSNERVEVLPTFDPLHVKVTMQYFKGDSGFVLVTKETPAPIGAEVFELECELDLEGMFGGPLVYFQDKGGQIFLTKRSHAPVSLAIHFPHGGVSARDGIGDWDKAFSLSIPGKEVD